MELKGSSGLALMMFSDSLICWGASNGSGAPFVELTNPAYSSATSPASSGLSTARKALFEDSERQSMKMMPRARRSSIVILEGRGKFGELGISKNLYT